MTATDDRLTQLWNELNGAKFRHKSGLTATVTSVVIEPTGPRVDMRDMYDKRLSVPHSELLAEWERVK